MYDATRRRNYSAAGERFRKEHQRHRDWGLEQRHRKKLCDLYGSVEAAEAYFAERARAALAPASPEPPVEEAEPPAPPDPSGEQAELPVCRTVDPMSTPFADNDGDPLPPRN